MTQGTCMTTLVARALLPCGGWVGGSEPARGDRWLRCIGEALPSFLHPLPHHPALLERAEAKTRPTRRLIR